MINAPMQIKKRNTLIKIIRRADAEVIRAAAVQVEYGTKPMLPGRPDNNREGRSNLRNLDSVVRGWINERKENSRIERAAAMEILDGKALLAG